MGQGSGAQVSPEDPIPLATKEGRAGRGGEADRRVLGFRHKTPGLRFLEAGNPPKHPQALNPVRAVRSSGPEISLREMRGSQN